MNFGGHATVVIAIFIIIWAALYLQYPVTNPYQMFLSPSGTLQGNNPPPATASGSVTPTTLQGVIAACKVVAAGSAPTVDFKTLSIEYRGGSTKDPVTIEGETSPHVLRRSSVPFPSSFFTHSDGYNHNQKHKDDYTGPDGKKYEVYYPMKSGELLGMDGEYFSPSRCEDPSGANDKCETKHRIYFYDFKLVFLRHLDATGQPIKIPGTDYNLAEIYQDEVVGDGHASEELPDEAFKCAPAIAAPAPVTPVTPPQPPAPGIAFQSQESNHPGDDLQLSWFIFTESEEEVPIPQPIPELKFFELGCKPAVYLYPPNEQLVNVKVIPNGFLTYTDPIYDFKTGWTVTAFPDGSIYNHRTTVDPKEYPYLYYESKVRDEAILKPTNGWVVKSKVNKESEESTVTKEWFGPMEDLFKDVLPKLGLNEIQTADFIEYWEKALPYAPYYFVGIIDPENVDEFERLAITPPPDYVNRVRVYFERLDQPKQVQEPVLNFSNLQVAANDPSLFRVVEWGGMIKNDPNHPFTCSQ